MTMPRSTKDFSDPFNAGQMVGMLVMLTYIEQNGGISGGVLDEIRATAANNAQSYFNKPAEDIFLMIDNLVKEIRTP